MNSFTTGKYGTSIDLLPQEVLHLIYQYLDFDSLKSALKVSQRWSDIIKSSPNLTDGLQIKVVGTSDDGSCSVQIPIDGLSYKNLHLSGHIKDCQNFQEVMRKYGKGIQHVTLENFKSEMKNIADELPQVTSVSAIGNIDLSVIQNFEKLKTLDVKDVESLEGFEHLKLRLISLKIQNSSNSASLPENVNNFIADQSQSLREISMLGIPLTPKIKSNILKVLSLRQLEMSSDELLVADPETLNSIILFKKWTKFEFVNPSCDHMRIVEEIVRKNKDLKILKITSHDRGTSLPSSNTSIFDDIPNFKCGIFKFDVKLQENKNILDHLENLTIKRLDNESQLKNLIKFLKSHQNVSILKLNLVSLRAKLDRNMKELLEAVNCLNELHIEAYSDEFDISSETFEIIKLKARNLRKLSIKVGRRKVEKMKEKSAILLESKVQTFVMKQGIKMTRLDDCESLSHESSSKFYCE